MISKKKKNILNSKDQSDYFEKIPPKHRYRNATFKKIPENYFHSNKSFECCHCMKNINALIIAHKNHACQTNRKLLSQNSVYRKLNDVNFFLMQIF